MRKYLRQAYEYIYKRLQYLKTLILEMGFYDKKRVCPVCRKKIREYRPFGIVPRKNARCPNCGALERDRALWLYFEKNTALLADKDLRGGVKKLLHFAPEKVFYDKFSKLSGVDYYPVDINLSKKIRDVKIRDVIDIQKISYQSEMFDFIICSHVLEHVPDDHEAMRELCRVLKRDGTAYINVPIFNGLETTFEDPAYNTPELRLKYYDQKDHVRKYGKDFTVRLTSAGFNVEVIELTKDLGEQELFLYGLDTHEKIYKCTVSFLEGK